MYKIHFSWITVTLALLTSSQRVLSQGACNNTWITRPGYNVLGGLFDSSAYTVQLCRDSCLRFPSCKGFDFDGSSKCWIVLSGEPRRNTGSFVTHYQLLRGLNSCTVNCSTSGNAQTWIESSDSHINGGSYTDDKTLEACLKSCGATCRGFDWDQNNPSGLLCWTSAYGKNPIQNDSPGVNHYRKECTAGGLYVVAANPPSPNQGSSPFSTVSTMSYAQQTWITPRFAEANQYVYVKQQAIRPAYIVMAGLGGGCILLVIIAVTVLCMYPLKGSRSSGSGGGSAGVYSKTKTTKSKTIKSSNDMNSRRPKALSEEAEEEHIGMSTVTSVPEERGSSSYDRTTTYSETKNHRTSNGSAAVTSAGYAGTKDDNDDYNRNNGGGSTRYSGGQNDNRSARNSGGSERQSTAFVSDDYAASRHSGEGSQRGYNNQGYNTVTSMNSAGSSKSAGYTNEGYNTVNSRSSHKSGYEDNPYDRDSQAGTLSRAHERVESIAEETMDDYQNNRNSRIEGNPTYNQEDFY